MLRAGVAIVLGILPYYAAAQNVTQAKCLAGFEWSYSSTGQNPCDIAASLAGVCVGGQFTLAPLDSGFVYLGPSSANANSCRCSSVYYSLLSACANCQQRNWIKWSAYNANCSTVYSEVFVQPIPVGVHVPAYAYMSVESGDTFNVTTAQNFKGVESTRPPTPSSTGPGGPSNTAVPQKKKSNAGAIAGGVVGGIVGLALLGALIFFLLRRRKQKAQSPSAAQPVLLAQDTGNTHMAYTPNTNTSFAATSMSPPPGPIYNPNDPSTFPIHDQPTGTTAYNPYTPEPAMHQSPFANQITPHYTGGSQPSNQAHHPHYTGAPEL